MNRQQRRQEKKLKKVPSNYKRQLLEFFNIKADNPMLVAILKLIRKENGIFELPGLFNVNHDDFMKHPEHFEHKIDCTKGCAHCCHMAVDISEFEFPFLRQTLSKLSVKNKEEIKKRAKFRLDTHKDLTFNERLTAFTPCPLLSEKNTCMIYEGRPMNCREFTSPDVKLCEKMINKEKDEEIKQLYGSKALSTVFDVAGLLAKSENLYYPGNGLRLEWAIYNILISKEEREKAEDYIKVPLEKWKPIPSDLKDIKIKGGKTGEVKNLIN